MNPAKSYYLRLVSAMLYLRSYKYSEREWRWYTIATLTCFEGVYSLPLVQGLRYWAKYDLSSKLGSGYWALVLAVAYLNAYVVFKVLPDGPVFRWSRPAAMKLVLPFVGSVFLSLFLAWAVQAWFTS